MAGTEIKLTGLPGIKTILEYMKDATFGFQMMGEIGMYAMFQIKKRTIKGKDVDGLVFKPYNPFYAKARAKDGYKQKPVDLTRTGSMLSSMTFDSDQNSANIFFMNTTDNTGARNPDKAFWNNEDREFFALSEDEVEGIMKIVDKFYRKIMRS